MASRVTCGRDKGIAVAVAADPGAEAQHLGQFVRLDLQAVRGAQGLGDFAVEAGQRGEDGDVVVVEPHLDFVVDGGPARADFVGLPQAGDLGQHQLFQAREVLLGDGNAVERGQEFADAAALEHHGAARNLSGMRGKNRHDEHALSQSMASSAPMPTRRISHSVPASEPRCRPAWPLKLQGDAAALAVVGFGQVDELEVEGEGAGEQDGALDGQRVDQLERGGGVAGGFFVVAAGFGVAAADGALAQRFDVREEVVAGLLAQHFAQQHAQRAHVAAQGRFFQIAGLGFELGQPLRPAFGIPQKGHRVLIMHDGPEMKVQTPVRSGENRTGPGWVEP